MKKSNIITLNPQYFPYRVYHQPLCQLRLLPRVMLIYRPTAFPQDVTYARSAFGHALYWHYEVVTVETWWAELPATFKRWVLREGMRVVLCGTLKEARNSADVRWGLAG